MQFQSINKLLQESFIQNWDRPDEEVTVAGFIDGKSRYEWSGITPHLWTKFHRITLVNKAKTERLTIDMDLVWENVVSGISKSYADLVIIELKRDGRAKPNNLPPLPPIKGGCHRNMVNILQSFRIKPLKISKYCIGTALTTPGLKRNRFKAKIRKIEKICYSK